MKKVSFPVLTGSEAIKGWTGKDGTVVDLMPGGFKEVSDEIANALVSVYPFLKSEEVVKKLDKTAGEEPLEEIQLSEIGRENRLEAGR